MDAEGEGSSSASLASGRTEIRQDQSDMLEALAAIPDLRVKNQQRSDSDLTKVEKHDVLKNIFLSSPMQFLTRFGEFLEPNQLNCFDEIAKRDNNLALYLAILKKNNSSKAKRLRAKNRRYAALQKLVDTTDYFTEEEMQRRNPILFDQLIGKYHTKAEREGFLARSEKLAASTSKTPLTDLLMAHMNRNEDGESYRRLDQEQQKADEDAADAEYYANGMECDDDEDSDRGNEKSIRNIGGEEEEGEELEEDEKELLKEEFFTTMYRDFLEGKDKDFDYSTVDNNDEFDVGENLEQDEEDAYFQDEEPCELHSDPNSDADLNFRPPVRSSEIESKINSLSVSGASSSQPAINDDQHNDSEDDLDAYMREIESQLQNKR